MTVISEFLLPSDINFYRNYAIPIINNNARLFDLDGFHSTLKENKEIDSQRTIHEAYQQFLKDKCAQYEMHPKYGRYVWDITDQWYQKWNVVFSVEHMWNWIETEAPNSDFSIQPWLNRINKRYNLHPNHQLLLQDICNYISNWHKSNRSLTLKGTFKINTLPFFPPNWFKNKSKRNSSLAPSYLAHFIPPYKPNSDTPERWDQVFLKGLTLDFSLDPILIASAIPILGLTVDIDEPGYSKLMIVMPKAKYGNLEDQIQNEIPTDYLKPCQLALSITKDIKDLHWNYVHGNIHPRNILLNNADYLGELVDVTFMKKNNNNQQLVLAGRWPYVAPEVIHTGLSTSADIYALGIVLWQLISRVTFPLDALVDPSIYRIEPIPGVLEEYQQIYIDCLNIDPQKRPNAYQIHKRLSNLCSRLTAQKVQLSAETLDYISCRKLEINQFLLSSSNTSSLCQVGDLVLTASITRPSHQRLQSYPALVQSSFFSK